MSIGGIGRRAFLKPRDNPHAPKPERLRKLAIAAYWAASTPTEAKMAGILLDLFAPDVSDRPPPRNLIVWTA